MIILIVMITASGGENNNPTHKSVWLKIKLNDPRDMSNSGNPIFGQMYL